jgi:hypothetical protein
MIKMLEIRKALMTLLREANLVEVHYQKPSEKANYPYILLDISSSIDDGTLERFILDVEGIGQGPSTVELETMMDTADKALHRKSITISKLGRELVMSIYRENRLTFDETDKRLFRRRYTYQIRTHEK